VLQRQCELNENVIVT